MTNGGIKYFLARLNIAEKIIAINVAVFILTGLFSALLGWSIDTILYWFELPKDFFAFLSKPWSLVTYSFFHAGFGHIFWNMLILYFTGRIFLNLFDNQRFINVYFLGVILGGLVFLISYNIFPTLLHRHTLKRLHQDEQGAPQYCYPWVFVLNLLKPQKPLNTII